MRRRVSLSVCRQTGKNRRAHTVIPTPNIAPTGAAAIVGGCPHTPRASRRQFVHGQSSRHTGTTTSSVIQEARHVSLLPRSCPRPPLPPPRVAKWWLPRKRRNCAFREPAEDPDRSVLTRPSHTHRYLMYYLDEKGIRVYTLKVRARFPTRPGRSEPESSADWRKKPSRNVTPRLTEPPLVLAARVDPRKPHPTAAPRSRRTPRGLAPTISSPSSAWRARSASGCCRPRNPFPSFETRETASMISLSTTVRAMRRGARGRSRRETPSVHHP